MDLSVQERAALWGTEYHQRNTDGSTTVVTSSSVPRQTTTKTAKTGQQTLQQKNMGTRPSRSLTCPVLPRPALPPKPQHSPPKSITPPMPQKPKQRPPRPLRPSRQPPRPPNTSQQPPSIPPLPTQSPKGSPKTGRARGNISAAVSPRSAKKKLGQLRNRARAISQQQIALLERKTSAASEQNVTIGSPNNGEVREINQPPATVQLVTVKKGTASKWWATSLHNLGASQRDQITIGPTLQTLRQELSAVNADLLDAPDKAGETFQLMTLLQMTANHQRLAKNNGLNALETLICLTNEEYKKSADLQRNTLSEISTQISKSFYPKMTVLLKKLQESNVHVYVKTKGKAKIDKKPLIQGLQTFLNSAFKKRVKEIAPSWGNGELLEQSRSGNFFDGLLKKWPDCLHANESSFSETCIMMQHYLSALKTLESTYLQALNKKAETRKLKEQDKKTFDVSVEQGGKPARVTIEEVTREVKERDVADLLAQLSKELATYLPPLKDLCKYSQQICTSREQLGLPCEVEKMVSLKFQELKMVVSNLLSRSCVTSDIPRNSKAINQNPDKTTSHQ